MSSWIDRLIFRDPETKQVYMERPKVEGKACPACGSDDVRRYPVACHLGARIVTRCQECMEILAMDRPGPEDVWPPFKAVAYDWPASGAERASRSEMARERKEGEVESR